MNREVAVIVNPASGRGRGARRLGSVRRAFSRVGVTQLHCTRHAGDERELAAKAIEDGATTLIAVGGDGTWSNVADAILTSGAPCRLGLIAAGTGNDFAKSIGAPAHDVERTARLAVDGTDIRVDVGFVEGRHFLNMVGFGFDTAVLEGTLQSSSLLRGRALYLSAALRQLWRYKGIPICVAAGGEQWQGQHLLMIVANARHFGGSFHIAPSASPHDGLLDAISIYDAPVLRRAALFRAAIAGRHMHLPEVRSHRAEKVTLRFETPPPLEADGEYRLASAPKVEVQCLPSALRVVMG